MLPSGTFAALPPACSLCDRLGLLSTTAPRPATSPRHAPGDPPEKYPGCRSFRQHSPDGQGSILLLALGSFYGKQIPGRRQFAEGNGPEAALFVNSLRLA